MWKYILIALSILVYPIYCSIEHTLEADEKTVHAEAMQKYTDCLDMRNAHFKTLNELIKSHGADHVPESPEPSVCVRP